MNAEKQKSRGDVEAEIRQAIIRFEKEYLGRGPLAVRTYFLDDMVMIRLEGALTPAELRLAGSEDDRLRGLLKQMRRELLERGRPMLEVVIQDILGIPVQSVHSDISTRTGERVLLFRLKEKLPPSLADHRKSRNGISATERTPLEQPVE